MEHLRMLYLDLLDKGKTTDVFSVRYNKKGFSCVFTIQNFGCTLYISTLGADVKTVSIEFVDLTFPAPSFLDSDTYMFFATYLGFTGASGNRFIPSLFFNEFDKEITTTAHRMATERERVRAIGNDIKTSEDDKKYFCGWRNNGNSGNVTDKNYIKTKRIVDEAVAFELRRKNVSSKWTSFEKDEDLAKINEFTSYLD